MESNLLNGFLEFCLSFSSLSSTDTLSSPLLAGWRLAGIPSSGYSRVRKSSLPGCLVLERHSRRPERFDMTTQKWSDIRAQKFTPEELREIDQEIENELLKMERSQPDRRKECPWRN
jgi:hypothetical protein